MISERFTSSKQLLLIAVLISKVASDLGKNCSIASLSDAVCSEETETCVLSENAVYGICECNPGYTRSSAGSDCVKSTLNGNTIAESHSMAWTITTLIIFVAFVIVGVYFSYKLRLVSWLKYKLNQRYNRSYDDVMIGQDDE